MGYKGKEGEEEGGCGKERKEEGGRALACGRCVCVGGVHTTAIQKDDLSVFPCPSATEDFFRALYLHEEPHHNILLKRAREGPSH